MHNEAPLTGEMEQPSCQKVVAGENGQGTQGVTQEGSSFGGKEDGRESFFMWGLLLPKECLSRAVSPKSEALSFLIKSLLISTMLVGNEENLRLSFEEMHTNTLD